MESIGGRIRFLRGSLCLAVAAAATIASWGYLRLESAQPELRQHSNVYKAFSHSASTRGRTKTVTEFVFARQEYIRRTMDDGILIPRRDDSLEKSYEEFIELPLKRIEARSELHDAQSAFSQKDYMTAIRKALPAARLGYPDACGLIGVSYRELGNHLYAYVWLALAGEHYRAINFLEERKLSYEQHKLAREAMDYLKRDYCYLEF